MNEHNQINPREMKTFIDKRIGPKMEKIGLTPAYGYFLYHLSMNEGCSLKDLSYSMNVDKALCTRNAKWLMDNGFIVNKSKTSSKFELYLTEKGNKAAELTEKERKNVWIELMKYTSDEEKVIFKEVWIKIKQVIDEDKQ